MATRSTFFFKSRTFIPVKATKLFFILFIFGGSNAYAQWEMGLGINAIAPQGELVQNNYPWGIGVDFTLVSPTVLNKASDLKLQFGLAFGGSDNGRKKFQTNGQFEDGSLEFYNCIGNIHTTTRLTYKPHPRIGLFAETIGGYSYFHSGVIEETETDDSYNYNHQKVSTRHMLRYGGGIGGAYFFSNFFHLDLRLDYTKGASIEFIDMSSTKRTEDGYTFDLGQSANSDLINIQIRASWLLLQKKENS